MYCPRRKAEYRQGFTHCADCDVDLVEEYAQVREGETPDKWSEVLWRGKAPHFCLTLIAALGSKNVPCLGRPANPPGYDSFEEQPAGSYQSVEFEVRVSEENLSFARWILKSEEEMLKEQEQEKDSADPEAGESDIEPDVTGVCPLCFAEFTTPCSLCLNCGVPVRAPRGGFLAADPGKLLSDLPNPQFLANPRLALRRVVIPFNNANFSDGPDSRRTDVIVLPSDFDRATQVLAQVLQSWEFNPSIRLGLTRDPRESYWPVRARSNGWYFEDLELRLWTGTSVGTLDYVGMALREHEIPYRVEAPQPGSAKVFVHPEDEQRAREILQEVLDGPASG